LKRFLLSGGLLVDGTGGAARRMDVLVGDGVIEDVLASGTFLGDSAEVVDCSGKVVAPGFIDRHAHSDLSALAHPGADSKLAQGVTTEVNGQCGSSPFPVASGNAAEILKDASVWHVDVDWADTAGYRKKLSDFGTSINRVPFVGHGTLRGVVASYEDRRLAPEELDELERLADRAVDEGARGISAGLIYPPGCFSDTPEMLRVAAVAARRGVPLALHIRGEGDRLLDAIDEVILLGRETGARILVAHLKTYGPRNWAKIDALLEKLDAARRSGLDLTADRYPYLASNTGLSAVLPLWAQEGGDVAVVDRLRSRSLKARILEEITRRHPNEEDYWERVVITTVAQEGLSAIVGKSVAEVAAEWKTTPAEASVRILSEDHNGTSAIYFMMNQENLVRILQAPYVAVASDAAALPLDAALVEGRPHPRAFGTFPRVLARHVREKKELMLEEAVRKMTLLPAQSLGIADRGRIAAGLAADVVVFDPETVLDRAAFNAPVAAPAGIELVMVNGEIAWRNGAVAAGRPGRVL